jgi:hypothetical protein
MKEELDGAIRPKLALYKKKPYPKIVQIKEHTIDIATISALGMHYNLRIKENEAFITSLYEIDWIIQDRKDIEINAINPGETPQ